MMMLPTGYTSGGTICAARGMLVVRAVREGDDVPVVISGTHGLVTPEPHRRRLDAEAECHALLGDPVARASRIDEKRQSWLVVEGVEGGPIDTSRAWSLDEFWAFAPLLLRALLSLHQKNCVHGALESSCIWWAAAHSSYVTLLGGVPAARVSTLGAIPPTCDTAPELITAPDQSPTPAADIYSLGCILYRLLAGRPPIATTASLTFEIASTPPPPLEPAHVPSRLADLVIRMLSKSPSARPAGGVVYRELMAIGAGEAIADAIRPTPTTLVGRGAELERLMGAATAAAGGTAAALCIVGQPGVGKSYLIAEFVRRLASLNLLTGAGKFEQTHVGQPYSALLAACQNALGRALSGEELTFTTVRNRLRAANPVLLGFLASYLRELTHLCGPLPEAPDLGPAENRNRFVRACLELIGTLGYPGFPLVLVLDDAHWADRATTELLADLLESGLPPHFLLVLSLRKQLAEANAGLRELLGLIPDDARIEVEPFQASQTEEFCKNVIHGCESASDLASAVQQRTGGNALYCLELLRSLAANGQLAQVAGHWSCSDPQVRFTPASETVVDLIRARLASESERTREILGAAACIGSVFTVAALAAASDLPADELEESLTAARRHGLVDERVGVPAAYGFCHDRVQESALAALSTHTRAEIQLRLGRYYRTLAATEQFAVFHCIDHLNAVRASLEPAELNALRELNFDAALRARRTIAYQRAADLTAIYLEGTTSPELRFEALLLMAECSFLGSGARQDTKDGAEAWERGNQALQECASLARSNAQRLRLLKLRLALDVYNQRYSEAVELGLEALRILKHPLPSRPSMARVIARAIGLSLRMRKLDPQKLLDLPDRTPKEQVEVSNVLAWLSAPAHWARPLLGAIVLIRQTELALAFGNGPQSSVGYAGYGLICHLRGDYETSVRYGRLAEKLAEKQSVQARTMVRFQVLTFFNAFELNPTAIMSGFDRSLSECVAHGDMFASHLIDGAVTLLPFTGWNIERVEKALVRYELEARTAGAGTSVEAVQLVRAWCAALTGALTAASMYQEASAVMAAPLKNQSFKAVRAVLKMQLAYLVGNDAEALSLSTGLKNDPVVKDSLWYRASYWLFVLLATTRLHGTFSRSAREALAVIEKLDSIRVDGAEGPANFHAPLLLARGIEAALRGAPSAIELLEDAASAAAKSGQELLRAVALERLAELLAARRQYGRFVERLRDAAQAFQRFGAQAKVDALTEAHPGIDWSHLASRHSRELDVKVEGVMRAASAIAEVTSAEQLGPTLLRVIATTAGAMRAFLFVPRDGKLYLVAGCERDRVDTTLEPTSIDDVAESFLALRPVRYVARAKESIEFPRDESKFTDDPYLLGKPALQALLCVPLLYRAEMVAILYLEESSNFDRFSGEDAALVTLLGRHAAIALTNADTHRFEIEALQAKVNPHFLYNALSVITELIASDPDAAEDAVFKLTKLYRYMLSTPANQFVPLEKELSVVRDYLELEKARFGARLKVVWDVKADISSFRVPALLVQPLAENAVTHGVGRNVEGGTVVIAVREVGDGVVLSVSDDGPGWYEGKGGTGFGLRSVRRRLELMYGDRASLQITKGAGISVEITLPW
jgi:predicted ATPase/GAF domain-containing protein